MNLKYTDNQGKEHFLNSYKINNIIVSQEKGQSEADVMSQKAVTDELEKLEQKITDIDVSDQLQDYALTSDVDSKLSNKADKTELNNYYTKSESDGKYLTEHQSLTDYAKTAEVNSKLDLKADKTSLDNYYTKQQSDGKYLTEHQSLEDYFTKEEIEEFFEEINSKDFAEFTDYPELQNAITFKVEDNKTLVVDSGEY